MRARRPQPRYTAAEQAWLLEALCLIGAGCRERGWCVGELRPGDLVLSPAGLTRCATPKRSARRVNLQRREKHLREGHDPGCWALGVPRSTQTRLLRAWGGGSVGSLLDEAIDQAVRELIVRAATAPWSRLNAEETLRHAIRTRITPTPPHPQNTARAEAPKPVRTTLASVVELLRFRDRPRTGQPRDDCAPA